MNLGAGAELGIYREVDYESYVDNSSYKNMALLLSKAGSRIDHHAVDRSLAMPMTMKLYDKNGNAIIDYSPTEDQWWITGFNPLWQNIVADDISAVFSIDFTGNMDIYKAFNAAWHENEDWLFLDSLSSAILTFKGGVNCE